MADDSVNIRIKRKTWKRLNKLKDEPGKTWDDVMQELLEETSEEDEEGNPSRMTPETAD
jgi:predicted DNA-binding protein